MECGGSEGTVCFTSTEIGGLAFIGDSEWRTWERFGGSPGAVY